jgi:hypothetical protein
MKGINTNGIYDTVGLINSIIVDLNNLEVKGVVNMKIIFDTIGKLDALRKHYEATEGRFENANTKNG